MRFRPEVAERLPHFTSAQGLGFQIQGGVLLNLTDVLFDVR